MQKEKPQIHELINVGQWLRLTDAGSHRRATLLVAFGAAVAGDPGDAVLAGTLSCGLVARLACCAHRVAVTSWVGGEEEWRTGVNREEGGEKNKHVQSFALQWCTNPPSRTQPAAWRAVAPNSPPRCVGTSRKSSLSTQQNAHSNKQAWVTLFRKRLFLGSFFFIFIFFLSSLRQITELPSETRSIFSG